MTRSWIVRTAALALVLAVGACKMTVPRLPTEPTDPGSPEPPGSAFAPVEVTAHA
jgi:hypothetical protein